MDWPTQARIRNAFFQSMETAMMVGGIWELSRIREGNPNLDLGLALPPMLNSDAGPGINLGTWVYALPSGSRNVELGWELVEVVLGPSEERRTVYTPG